MSRSLHTDPGTVALYVMGLLSPEERKAVEAAAAENAALRAELDDAQEAMAILAIEQQVDPPAGLRTAILEAVERAETEGRKAGRPPALHPGSLASDYGAWLNDPRHVRPAEAGPLHVIELDDRGGDLTALVWLTHGSPEEVHVDVIEKFLILEGACDITVGDEVHSLRPGSYLSIPLYVPHNVRITSAEPCKILLQRLAA